MIYHKSLMVQLVGHHDLDTHRTTISWKLKTKWAVDQHSIFTKQKFHLNELLTLRTHSKVGHAARKDSLAASTCILHWHACCAGAGFHHSCPCSAGSCTMLHTLTFCCMWRHAKVPSTCQGRGIA